MMNKLRAAAKKEVGLIQMYWEGAGWLKEYLLKLLNLRLTLRCLAFSARHEHCAKHVLAVRDGLLTIKLK